MAELSPEKIAELDAWIQQGKRILGMIPAEGEVPTPEDGSAPPAEGGDQFSTPALATSPPTSSAPTIEPVPEDEVPDEVKAQDQGA